MFLNKISNVFGFTVFIMSTLFLFSFCKKERTIDNETQTVIDNSICEQQFNTIIQTINEKIYGSMSLQGFRINSCESARWISPSDTTIDNSGAYISSTLPTFTLNYTELSCLDADGVKKLGKIYITPTHKWTNIKTTMPPITHTLTIGFNNYSTDGVFIDGKMVVIKNGNTLKTKVEGHCSNSSKTFNITYSSDKSIDLLSDGSIKVWGTSNGTNRNGKTFVTNINQTNPLIKKNNCKFISSGLIEVSPQGFSTRTVNYGSGNCDDDANYTLNGQVIAFKLKNN